MKTGMAALLLALAAPLAAQPSRPEVPTFTAEVARVRLDVRVLGADGSARLGLTARDFVLKVDGREVPVESATWIGGTRIVVEAPGAAPGAPPVTVESGRLLLLFFQVDLHPSRAPGLIRLVQECQRLLTRLGPGDRVAVATFDSRLRLWQDFTTAHEFVRRILPRTVLFGEPVGQVDTGILGPHVAASEAGDAATMEQAFQVLAKGLESVRGSKSIVLVGATMGTLQGPFVFLDPAYDDARRRLARSRTTVFALDATNADYHTLEVGLKQVAADTGGLYARTHVHTRLAVNRVEGALAGHYLLSFESPPGDGGWHDVELSVPGAEVLVAKSYRDAGPPSP